MTLLQKIKTGAALFTSIAALNTQAAPSCGGHICTPQELDCMENPALCNQASGPNQPPSSFLQNGYSIHLSYTEAAQDAINKATAECHPLPAIRLTPFQFHQTPGDFVAVSASAYFKCD